MKFENLLKKMYVRYTAYGLAALVMAILLIGTPFFSKVSAQKGGGGTTDTGKTSGDKTALEAARAVLKSALDSGKFEQMSSAKQQALLLQARQKLDNGVLKDDDYVAVPGAPRVFERDPAKEPYDGREAPQSPLANPLVNNPALDTTAQKTQSETTVVVTGANTLVASYNDSGSFLGGVNSFTGYSTTTDMGTSWTDRGIVPLLGDQNFGDPVLARSSSTGTVFLATLAGGANGMNIYRSTDSGVTFTSLANGAPGANSGDTDKEWITVDNNAGTGNGFVYHSYRDFGAPNGIFFTRSTNDGVSYSSPILIASGAAGNVQGTWVFVGSDHAVYVGYYDSTTNPDRIAIRKSTDNGVTFAAAVGVSNLVTTGTNGSLNVPAGYRSSAFPQFIASPTNANLLFAIHPDITVAGGSDSNIFFQQSTDGGATWSANVRLNTDAGTNVQTQPSIAITPDGTALCVTWQDSRLDAANRKVARFGVIGTISGTTVTFGPNFQVSQPDWSPVFGADPVVNTVYMGDYDQGAADNSFFYTTFVDCRLGDQDVRFAKIPKAGPGAIISFGGATPNFLAVARSTCTDLTVTLNNTGTATATGVTATFTTSTPGVTLSNATQNYGNIAPGASANNPTPIKLSIDNTFVCGTTITINVTVSTGDSFSFTIGTQGLGYQATTMTGQTIVPGTTDVGNHTDDGTTAITLPFAFSFYGNNFTTANVSSNGNLQFTSNNTAFSNVCPFPIASMNNLVAPHWDDLRTDNSGGGIFTSTSGSAPNRIFNIEWRAIYFGTSTTLNFEIRLYETTGQIDFVYGTLNGTGSSATVGIQKGTGSGGSSDFTSFSCNAAGLSAGLKVSFTPLTTCPTGNGPCVTVVPCSENFDTVTPPALPTGWSATTGTTCVNSTPWVTSSTLPDTAPNDAFTNDPNCISDERLDSKPFPIIAAGAVLTFRHTFAMESSGSSFFDGGVVEISIGGGAFTDIITAGGSFVAGTQGYVGTISSSFGNPLAGRMAFSGTNAGGFGVYVTTSINLPASTNGQSVVIRWRRGSDSSVAATGWRIDTVSVTNSNCGGGAACSLTCPANITVSTDPNLCSAIVNYPPPTSTGTCGTITCTPPSGSPFPKGTTTVTCSASGGAAVAEVDTKTTSTAASSAGQKGSSAGQLAGPGSKSRVPTASSGAISRSAVPTAPQSPFAVLYDQTDNPSAAATSSQNFEAAFDAFDDLVADDFVVPAGQTWTINQVFTGGVYFNGAGPAGSVNVVFYGDSSTFPGAVVATRNNAVIATDSAGNFTITISPTVVLSPGTYWVSVQANMDFGVGGQWGWLDRTVISNSAAVWSNPGGGFAAGCSPGFGRKTDCVAGSAPDNIFQILGTIGGGGGGGGSTCTFTVTVNDTQPPSITCPPNISTVVPNPGAMCTTVTYCPPTVTDNCPNPTFACVPPSGSCLPQGTTTVTCTATDTSGNTASCSFTVTVFGICIQDDSDPSKVLLFITSGTQIGQYRFCCNGTTFTGTGTVKQIGSNYTLSHTPPDRRVQATFNIDTTSTASLQVPPGTNLCTITDKPNIGVHTCLCGSPGAGCTTSSVATPDK
jgi:hypothetical protein